jgi:hypothetical protein
MRASAAPKSQAAALPQRWSQERRLEFIDFRLRWDGRLNRTDLTEFFGMSVPQASLDIARYEELAPRNLAYDRSARVYVAGADFRALYPSSSPQRYMEELLSTASAAASTGQSQLGYRPPITSLPLLQRTLDVNVVVGLQRAIRDKLAQRILYQSMSRSEPHERMISPHAFAHDGHRFHVRAFCHERDDFRDFVLGRILEVRGTAPPGRDGSLDHAWHIELALELAPHPKLPLAHRKAIALDYGMRDEKITLQCRQSFVFYVLKHLRLPLVTAASLEPREHQIVLKNWRDIARALNGAAPEE